MPWFPIDHGETIGAEGSEGGSILRDEEYHDSARITLERECRSSAFAITCGVYGFMVHTRFFESEDEAIGAYQRMRTDLGRIADRVPLDNDSQAEESVELVVAAVARFVEQFP